MSQIEFISSSKIHKFLWCPIAFKYEYIDPHGPKKENIYAIAGSATHSALEFYMTEKRDRSTPDNEKIKEKWADAFDSLIKKAQSPIEYDSMTTRKTLLYQSWNPLEHYLNTTAKKIKPKLIEHEFKIKLDTSPISIHGFIDLVDEDNVIIDYKTAGQDWKKKYSDSEVNKNIQLKLYSIAFRKEFKQLEARTEFHILPRNESESYIKQKFNTDEELRNVVDLATRIDAIVKLGVFIPNLANCSNCAYNTQCKKLPWVEKGGGFININT